MSLNETVSMSTLALLDGRGDDHHCNRQMPTRRDHPFTVEPHYTAHLQGLSNSNAALFDRALVALTRSEVVRST